MGSASAGLAEASSRLIGPVLRKLSWAAIWRPTSFILTPGQLSDAVNECPEDPESALSGPDERRDTPLSASKSGETGWSADSSTISGTFDRLGLWLVAASVTLGHIPRGNTRLGRWPPSAHVHVRV